MTTLFIALAVSAGTVDPAQLKAAVRKEHPNIMKCFAPESEKNPKLQGEVDVSFELLETGKTKGTKVHKTTLKNATTETCLVKIIAGMTFPKPAGGSLNVTYPFVFEPAIVDETPPPPKKPGSLPPKVVNDTIETNILKLRLCYDEGKKKDPKLFGKVVTQFLVEHDGKVSDAKVTETTLKNAEVETCLVAALKTIVFPQPDGETGVWIGYPFNFR